MYIFLAEGYEYLCNIILKLYVKFTIVIIFIIIIIRLIGLYYSTLNEIGKVILFK